MERNGIASATKSLVALIALIGVIFGGGFHRLVSIYQPEVLRNDTQSTNDSAVGTPARDSFASEEDRREDLKLFLQGSEELRRIETEWERIWFANQPSHLTPTKVHGDNQWRGTLERPKK